MSDKNRRRKRKFGDPLRVTSPTTPTPKPTMRQRKEYHNRPDTLVGHIDQVMNPGKIYRDPGTGPSIGRDRVVPALSEALLGTGRFIGDKMNAGKMKDGGPTKRKKSIDGIAQRGKTRAR